METKDEIIGITYNLLNQIQEGITDFTFHDTVKQTDDFFIAKVSYTWSLHGHKKPVSNIERYFYRENGTWKILI